MSNFDVNGYNSHECDIHNHGYYLGAQSQQAKIDAITKQRDSFIKAHHIAMNDVCEHKAKIDELQAIVYGLKRFQNNLELKAEDAECVSMSLDDQGVAKCDDDGKPYSLWGRVCQFKKSNNITECDLERIYWEFDQERKNSGGERVVFKNTLRSLLNNLKGNKDEN